MEVAQSASLWPHGLYSPWNSPGQNTGVGSLSLFQEIFPTQGLNPGLPHCRQIVHQLSHQGSPRILEWVAYPFSSRSSWLRNQTQVSRIAGGFFISWATREAWRRDYSSERSGFNHKGHLKTMIIYKVDSCKKTLKYCLFCLMWLVQVGYFLISQPTVQWRN